MLIYNLWTTSPVFIIQTYTVFKYLVKKKPQTINLSYKMKKKKINKINMHYDKCNKYMLKIKNHNNNEIILKPTPAGFYVLNRDNVYNAKAKKKNKIFC